MSDPEEHLGSPGAGTAADSEATKGGGDAATPAEPLRLPHVLVFVGAIALFVVAGVGLLVFAGPGSASSCATFSGGYGYGYGGSPNCPTGTGSISGTVTQAGTDAKPGTVVRVLDGSGHAWTDLTDANGEFEVTDLPEGSYTVTFKANGHALVFYDGAAAEGDATPVDLAADEHRTGVDAVLEPTAPVISGTITDASTGDPVAGVCVEPYLDFGFPQPAYSASSGCSLWTGASGQYVLSGLAEANYRIQASDGFFARYVTEWYGGSADYADATPVTLGLADATGVDIALDLGGRISGTVTDATNGTPLPGKTIAVYAVGMADGDPAATTVSVLPDGSFTTVPLPPADYLVRAHLPNDTVFVSEWYDDTLDSGSATPVTVTAGATHDGVDFALAHGAHISGTLVDEATGGPLLYGAGPLPAAVVVDATSGAVVAGGLRASDGSFFVQQALAPGTYLVGGGFFSIGAGTPTFTANAVQQGYLTEYFDDAYTLEDAQVVTITDATDVAGVVIDLVPQLPRIEGTVVDGVTGLPIAGAFVSLFDPVTGAGDFDVRFTGADGHFGFLRPAGSYGLRVARFGYADAFYDGATTLEDATPITLTEGTLGLTGLEIELSPLAPPEVATIGGTVTDAGTGDPIAGACILLDAHPGGGTVAQGCTNSFGQYAAQVPPGLYTVQFDSRGGSAPAYLSMSLDNGGAGYEAVVGSTTTVDVQLERGARVSGTITDAATGDPVAGMCAIVSGGAFGCSGADGHYATTALPTGEYTVRFFPGFAGDGRYIAEWYDDVPDEASATPLELTAGEDVAGIDAALSLGARITGQLTDATTGAPLHGCVDVLTPDGATVVASSECTTSDGSYAVNGVEPGSWIVRFTSPGFHTEFHDDVELVEDATPIEFSSGDDLQIDAPLAPFGEGLLRVVTDPPVPAVLGVDGAPRDMWGLTWMPIEEGEHTVCFGEVTGFVAPSCEAVQVERDETTVVTGSYTPVAMLRVLTEPALASTISIDGQPANDWGVWTALPVGPHQVCFGEVEGWAPPPCEDVELSSGETTTITGQFTADPEATGPADPYGYLRAYTSPAVPARISIDGYAADSWGLNWVKVPPGEHTVCFSDDVVGFQAPGCTMVVVPEGGTGEAVGIYTPRGVLRVVTDPALPAVVLIDGVRANAWGVWTTAPSGTRQVCFGTVDGFVAPECQDVVVTDGETTLVTGTYVPIE